MEIFNHMSLAEYLKAISKNQSELTGRKEKKKISEESAKVVMRQVFKAF